MQFNMQLNGIILFSYLLNPVDSLINLHQNTSENWLFGSDEWLGNVIELSVFFMVVALTYVACELTSALSGVFGFLCSVARQNLNTHNWNKYWPVSLAVGVVVVFIIGPVMIVHASWSHVDSSLRCRYGDSGDVVHGAIWG